MIIILISQINSAWREIEAGSNILTLYDGEPIDDNGCKYIGVGSIYPGSWGNGDIYIYEN